MNSLALELPDGTPALLLAQRALWLAARRTLVVADVHFGKTATFRARGVPLPRGTTGENLRRLDDLLAASGAATLVFLGDLFHAREAHARQTLAALRAWRARHRQVDMVLVEGNHDRHAGAPPADLGLTLVQEPWPLAALALCHQPQRIAGAHVLAGHLHPCVRLSGEHDRLRLPCFWIRDELTLLPAFGEFTGGATISRAPGDRVVAIGDGRLYEIPVPPAVNRA
jgi:DNA ligase-associated metallophosphoesterase